MEDRNIIPQEQFDFLPSQNTTQQIKRITTFVKQKFRNLKSIATVLLDVEKAFDTVWHQGLLYKLITFGFPGYLINVVKSFLTNR